MVAEDITLRVIYEHKFCLQSLTEKLVTWEEPFSPCPVTLKDFNLVSFIYACRKKTHIRDT